MNLLSGMEKFGFSMDGELDILADEKQKKGPDIAIHFRRIILRTLHPRLFYGILERWEHLRLAFVRIINVCVLHFTGCDRRFICRVSPAE